MINNRILTTAFFLCLFCIDKISSVPPKEIPEELIGEFTVNKQIPIELWYLNDIPKEPSVYTSEMINSMIKQAANRQCNYYGETDKYLYQALDNLDKSIFEKKIAIIGSATPWYESILLAYGAKKPVVIEYNKIITTDPRISYVTPEEYKLNPQKFDLILSISSTEHDGLGRYGDPIDPIGDLTSMKTFKSMLNVGGRLLLAVPVGKDTLVWNAHRIYGPIRLKMLLKGWTIEKFYGFKPELLELPTGYVQPIFVLKAKTI